MTLDCFRRTRLIVLPPHASAHDAARAMADHGTSTVLVGDRDGLAGIVTERDLMLALVADLDPRATSLAEVMSRDVATLDVGATVADAMHLMRRRCIRRIPILEDGRPVGIVTLDDLLLDGELSLHTRLIVAAQIDDAVNPRAVPKPPTSGVRDAIPLRRSA